MPLVIDEGCERGHVWVTYFNAAVSVCKNCGQYKRASEPYSESGASSLNLADMHEGIPEETWKNVPDTSVVDDRCEQLEAALVAIIDALDAKDASALDRAVLVGRGLTF